MNEITKEDIFNKILKSNDDEPLNVQFYEDVIKYDLINVDSVIKVDYSMGMFKILAKLRYNFPIHISRPDRGSWESLYPLSHDILAPNVHEVIFIREQKLLAYNFDMYVKCKDMMLR